MDLVVANQEQSEDESGSDTEPDDEGELERAEARAMRDRQIEAREREVSREPGSFRDLTGLSTWCGGRNVLPGRPPWPLPKKNKRSKRVGGRYPPSGEMFMDHQS